MWSSALNGTVTAILITAIFFLTDWGQTQPFGVILLLAAAIGLLLGLLQGVIERAVKRSSAQDH